MRLLQSRGPASGSSSVVERLPSKQDAEGSIPFSRSSTPNTRNTGEPMPSREKWTAADIPGLTGKVAVVTGGNSGIGFEAAKEFARKGAETILACRSPERGQAALDALRAGIPEAKAELMALDLASLASVEGFATEFVDRYPRLDLLINNAGIMAVPWGQTEDGFELQNGTNHLGHFALTGRLLDLLLATPGARVVNVSSVGHRRGMIDFDNFLYEHGDYGPWRAYFRSKLLNLLFTYELQRRFEAAQVQASSLAAHPGGSATNLGAASVRPPGTGWLFGVVNAWLAQSAAMGALPTLRAAVDREATGGQYYGPSGFYETRGHPVVVSSIPASHDEEVARRAWAASEELTGVRYTKLERSEAA